MATVTITETKQTNGTKRAAEATPDAKRVRVNASGLAQSVDIDAELERFLDKVWASLKVWWKQNEADGTKTIEQMKPEQLKQAVGLGLGKDEIGDNVSLDELHEKIEKVLKYSVRTSHPRFMNMLYGSTDVVGVMGEVIATFCNTNIHTFEVSPVFTMMEHEVMKTLTNLVGYTDGDGVFAPGGSMCNMFGMLMARNTAIPDIKMNGFGGKTLIAFTSAECHYSIQKGANLIGIGMNNAVKVKCNNLGQMIPEELEAAIQKVKAEGKVPFFVNSTAGTTVKGAFDDFNAIADVCEKHGLWMHVDAAWGGSVVMSPKRKDLWKGMNRADSITWDPHKGMGTPIQCAVVLTKRKGELMRCNQFKAEYLFKDANLEKIVARGEDATGNAAAELNEKKYDLGDKSLQCGRHVDVMKLWLMFKRHGMGYFEKRIENAFANRDHMIARMKAMPEQFQIVSDPMYTNLCFWYLPPSVRGLSQSDPKRKQLIDAGVQSIRRSLLEEGIVYINYQPQGELPNFFRPIFNSANTTIADVDRMVERIQYHGERL